MEDRDNHRKKNFPELPNWKSIKSISDPDTE